jgi:tetratricopeptide (TPR) repeat protein
MKNKIVILMLVAMIAALFVPMAYSQASCTVRGTVKGLDGKPMAGIEVVYYGPDTGRKYVLKTDKSGSYYAITVASGKYKITLQDDKGQPLYPTYFVMANVSLQVRENVTDIDLQKAAAESGASMSEEQKKKNEQAKAENVKIGELNKRLTLAGQQQQQGQYEDAVKTMEEAAQMDQSRDLIWASLGNAYLNAAKHNSDRAAAKDEYTKSADAYKKAIAIKPTVGAYYNNMGEAYAKLGQTNDAVAAYTQAAQNDPTEAARYYFNLGAVLTNVGKPDEANAAFDKAIAADPTKADAYYQKAVNLLSKATVDKDGKVIAPPEVAQGLNKYLELAPEGSYAQAAKDLLASLGAKVETSFGNAKKTPKKK